MANASPKARVNVGEQAPGEIKSPSRIDKSHAEEDLVNQLRKAIQEQKVTPAETRGKTVRMLIERKVCSTCRAGLSGNDVAPGVLKQLSEMYPALPIEVHVRGREEILIMQAGEYLKD